MKLKSKSYYNTDWYSFADRVRKRDGYKCLKCGRKEPTVTLQVHHQIYKLGVEPWEYPLSDCITLCKGCHAREHGLIEPSNGWALISIDDWGDYYSTCERKGCGHNIRYEHIIYHPKWGYKSVGSTCVEYLTEKDQFLSKEVVKILDKISTFIRKSSWEQGFTQKGKSYLFTKHAHHKIRIYGNDNYYSFQVLLKLKGERWYNFQDIIKAHNKTLDQVKELGFIVLKGLTTNHMEEKDILRNIYRNIQTPSN